MQSSPVPRIPAIRSVVNVPLRATLSLSTEGVLATSLNDCEEDGEEEAFHQFHQWRVQQSGTQEEATTPPHQIDVATFAGGGMHHLASF